MMSARYLDGQNCTSSTVSSCPWKTPRGPIEESSAAFTTEPADPVNWPAPVASVETWSWMLHNTTDLSFPVRNFIVSENE